MFEKRTATNRNLCFVIMPFAAHLRPVYDKVSEIAVQQHRLECVRGDDISSDGVVMQEVWQSICAAQFVVADLTGKNPNVFYEMGLAHALGKNVLTLAQSMNDVPFDLGHRRVIVYSPERLDDLGTKLSQAIETLKWQTPQIAQWIDTNIRSIKVGLASPVDGAVVNAERIDAIGRVVGLPESAADLYFFIQGFIKTDRVYEQSSSWIDHDGYWHIERLHLGSRTHKVFFKIYDEVNREIAKTKAIRVLKEPPHPPHGRTG